MSALTTFKPKKLILVVLKQLLTKDGLLIHLLLKQALRKDIPKEALKGYLRILQRESHHPTSSSKRPICSIKGLKVSIKTKRTGKRLNLTKFCNIRGTKMEIWFTSFQTFIKLKIVKVAYPDRAVKRTTGMIDKHLRCRKVKRALNL